MKNIRLLGTILTLGIVMLTLSACFSPNSVAKEEMAADFTLQTLEGKNVNLSGLLKGKKGVVLDFWATWCPYCVREIPHLEEYYQSNKKDVAVVGINLRESPERIAAFAKKMGMSYTVALDKDASVAGLYNVRGIPTVVAIDKNMNILYYGHSLTEMKQKVKF